MKYIIDDYNREFDDKESTAEWMCQEEDYETSDYESDLDDAYGKVRIAGNEYWTSDAFRSVDERAFDEGFCEWVNNRLYDDRNDLINDLRHLSSGDELEWNGYTIRCEDDEEESGEEDEDPCWTQETIHEPQEDDIEKLLVNF